MPLPTRPTKEIARLGKQIYERDILPLVEVDHHGEYVAIDVASGAWAIAGNESDAARRLRTRLPGAVDILMERVGYRALRGFGSGARRRTE